MSKGKQECTYSTASEIFDRLSMLQAGEQWRIDFNKIRPELRKLLKWMPDVKNRPNADHFVKPKHQCNGPGCKEIPDVKIDEEAEISSFVIGNPEFDVDTNDGLIHLTVSGNAPEVNERKWEKLKKEMTHHKVKLTIDGISDGDTSSHFGDAFDWAIHRQIEKDDNPGGILGIEQKRRDREERSAIKTINHRTYGLYKALRLYLEKLREKERAKDYKDEYNVERADVAIAAQALRDEYREWKAEMERYNDLANQRQYFGLMGTLERQANYVRDLEIGCWVADPNFQIHKTENQIPPPFTGVILTGGVKAEPKPADGSTNSFTWLDESGEIPEQYAELFRVHNNPIFVYDGFDWMGPDDEFPFWSKWASIPDAAVKVVEMVKSQLENYKHDKVYIKADDLRRLVDIAEVSIDKYGPCKGATTLGREYAAHYVDVDQKTTEFSAYDLQNVLDQSEIDPNFTVDKYIKSRSREKAFNSMREIISYIENHEPDILDDLNGLTFHFIGNKYDEEE